jgi:hypothetical protein
VSLPSPAAGLLPTKRSTLRVPDVEPGDIGLVLTVEGFLHDVDNGRWFVLCPEGWHYQLPPELSQWASSIDAEVRSRFLNLPKVFSFASVDGEHCVRLLSMA